MRDLLVILSLFVINTRSCDAANPPTSPPQFLPTDTEDAFDEDDEVIRMLADEDDDERVGSKESQFLSNMIPNQDPFGKLEEDNLIQTLEGLRYSGVGLFGNEERNIPWNEVYSNLRMRGKREPDSLYPWEAVYSLRGKKTVANLPWQMSLQSPMLRGKKSAPQMPWLMNLQSPMLRGKKTKTLVNLPWQMDLKSPMLRGKKSSSVQMPLEMTIENPILGTENTSDNLVDEMLRAKKDNNYNIKTKANLPWAFDYLSPMMRG